MDVAVLERGRPWPLGGFPRSARLDDGWLWACDHGLYDARPGRDILAVQAAGYGGGSLVCADVAFRPPHEVFAEWPAPCTRELLGPWFDLAAHVLGVSPAPSDPRTGEPPPETRLVREAVERVDQVEASSTPTSR